MNKKRLLAVLAAAVMLVSAVPVYAADNVVTGAGASYSVTGDSTVNDFDKTTKYEITLPTSGTLDFVVDPQGLIDLEEGKSTSVDITATGCGAIWAENGPAFIKNESSVAVVVTATFAVNAPTGVKFVTAGATETHVATGTDQAMFLAAIPSAVQPVETKDGFTYEATNQAVAISNGSALSFKLNAADYVVTKEDGAFKYVIVEEEGNYDSAAFKMGGTVNKGADWTTVSANDLSISAVFTFADATASDVALKTPYGVVSGSALVEFTPVKAEKTLEVTATSKAYTLTTGLSDLTVADIEKVTINGTDIDVATYCTVKNGVITMKPADLEKVNEDFAYDSGEELTFVVEVERAVYTGDYTYVPED